MYTKEFEEWVYKESNDYELIDVAHDWLSTFARLVREEAAQIETVSIINAAVVVRKPIEEAFNSICERFGLEAK